MPTLTSRLVGALAATATAGTLMVAAPASAVPVGAAATAGAARTGVSPATGERDPKVSRSLTGVRSSAYVGTYFHARYESARRCIVRKESGGNYRIASSNGRYRGAYQFNSALARSAARKMGRSDLAGKPMNRWTRFEQDKAFWIVWNHGRGAGNWPTRHGC